MKILLIVDDTVWEKAKYLASRKGISIHTLVDRALLMYVMLEECGNVKLDEEDCIEKFGYIAWQELTNYAFDILKKWY